MKTWSEWEMVRRQVAICGQVVDMRGHPVSGIHVTIVSMPESFSNRVSAAASMARLKPAGLDERLDRTLTRDDGSFYFLDLPDGKYTLNVSDARTGSQDQKETTVSWDKNGEVKMVRLNMQLAMNA